MSRGKSRKLRGLKFSCVNLLPWGYGEIQNLVTANGRIHFGEAGEFGLKGMAQSSAGLGASWTKNRVDDRARLMIEENQKRES